MMKRLLLIALTGLLVLVGLWWWLPSPQSVDVTLTLADDAPVAGMHDITVIVGGDKTGWGALKPGDTVHASFHPAPDDVPELTLIYRLTSAPGGASSDEKHHWRGPIVSAGQGYEIRMLLDSQGHVVGKHCVKPCSLD